MARLRTGTVTLVQGSHDVVFVGLDLIANKVEGGWNFYGGDGLAMEIAGVVDATTLTLVDPYRGASGAGQSYSIEQTGGVSAQIAQGIVNMYADVVAVRDVVGKGLFGDGSAATPGMRFVADQDTGLRRPGSNAMALVTGGVDRLLALADGTIEVPGAIRASGIDFPAMQYLRNGAGTWYTGGSGANGDNGFYVRFNSIAAYLTITSDGNAGVGTTTPVAKMDIRTASGAQENLRLINQSWDRRLAWMAGSAGFSLQSVEDSSGNAKDMLLQPSGGNLLVGTTGGTNHTIDKSVNVGERVLQVSSGGGLLGNFYAVSAYAPNGANATLKLAHDAGTLRALSTGGTINASGGDACECFYKSAGCGTILKGDICGIDANGQLTRTWADALWFGFKTTNPHLVGRDNWHKKAGKEPEAPNYVAPTYTGPSQPTEPQRGGISDPEPVGAEPSRPAREAGESDDGYLFRIAAYLNELTAYTRAAAIYPIALQQATEAREAQAKAIAIYDAEKADYDAAWAAHQQAVADAEAAHAVAMDDYKAERAAWTERLRAASKEIDRIATNGQVPVNFDGAFEPGQILVPIANGGGISMKAVWFEDATDIERHRMVGRILKRLTADDPDTTETAEIWGRPAEGKPWVFVHGLG